MERKRLRRLNDIFLDALRAGHNIGDYDEHDTWFEGSEEEVESKVVELEDLFNWAVEAGVISKWIEPGDRYRSMCWDWSSHAQESARPLGITLADPLGNMPLFGNMCDHVTTPVEMIRPISIDLLDNDLCGHLNRVYEEQVRYVVSHQGKPVAAVVPLVDLELLKDIQIQVEPCKWVEWIQSLRERLGWPLATFDEKEQK